MTDKQHQPILPDLRDRPRFTARLDGSRVIRENLFAQYASTGFEGEYAAFATRRPRLTSPSSVAVLKRSNRGRIRLNVWAGSIYCRMPRKGWAAGESLVSLR